MDKRIIERINNMKQNKLPIGYRRTKDIGIAPSDWKLGKMSDVVTPVKRAVPKPNKPYWRLGVRSWAKGTFHTYVDEPEIINMDELYMVHENDLIVNITFAWEHAIAIAKKEDQGLLVSHRFPSYEFKTDQCPDYYKLVLSQRFFKDMLDHISPGGAGRNRVLNQKDFLNLPCYIPPYDEQKRIAEILLVQDRMINLCEKKVNELKKLKKVFLQNMFPKPSATAPEWRFPGFTDAWEQRKVSEMFKITRGYVLAAPLTDENPSDAKPYPVYSSQTKDNGLMGYYKDYLYEDAITWTTDGANAGTVNYRGGKFYCTNVCGVLLADKVTPNQMIAEALNNVAKGHVSYVGNPKLMNNVMAEITISLPTSEKEREAISAFFDQIDNLITLHQREHAAYVIRLPST